MTEENQNTIPKRKSRFWRFIKRLVLLFLLFIVFLVGLVLLTQLPAVQKWGSKKIANYISGQLNTEVLVGGFRIRWTDEVELNDLLIRDLDRDTMIYLSVLKADLDKPIRGLMEGKMNLEGLALKDAFLNIKFKETDWYNNLDQVFKGKIEPVDSVLRHVAPKAEKVEIKKEQVFYLKDLELTNVRVRNYNEIRGKEENFYIGDGVLKNIEYNGSKNELLADELNVKNFIVDIENFDYDSTRYNEVFVWPPFADTSASNDAFPITLTAHKVFLNQGQLQLHNYRKAPVKTTPSDQLDWSHLDVENIEISGDSFFMKDWIFGGKLHQISATTSSGFTLVDGHADRILVTEQLAELDNFLLQTSMSTIQGDLKFIYDEYPDFQNFEDDVRFDFQSKDSELGVDDLMTFAPKLKNNTFLESNSHEVIHIDGRILGYVNNLKGRALNLRLGKQFVVNGLIDVRDFTDPNRTRINFNLQQLSTNMRTIKKLVPGLTLPDQWNELGKIYLTGQFNGLLKDFIASGNLRTDIGQAAFNMNLNFTGGVQNAIYGGELDLIDFDLGRWTSNPDFGMINLQTSISEGRGLVDTSASGNLLAQVHSFYFKGYNYQNARFEGLLKDQLINGTFSIKDDNIDLNFLGKIEIGERPHIDVTGAFEHLDLKALNLIDRELLLATDFNIDIRNLDPDRFTGDISLLDMTVGQHPDSLMHIDSLLISSIYMPDSTKVFTIESDLITADVNGQFRVLSLPNYFINYFYRFNPKIANKLKLKEKENLEPAAFDWIVDVHNSRHLLSYFNPDIDTLKDLHAEGWMNGEEGFFMKAKTPYLKVKDTEFNELNLYVNADKAYTNIVASHEGMQAGKVHLAPLTVFADLERDTVKYVFNEVDLESYLDQINIEGSIYVHDDQWQTHLYNSALQIFGEAWTISDNNYIRFGKDKLVVRNLNLSNLQQFIKIKSVNDDKGLSIDLQDLPLSRLNDVINYDRIQFDGMLSGNIRTNSLKNLNKISVDLASDQILINGDNYGKFELKIRNEETDKPFFADLKLINGNQRLEGTAEVKKSATFGREIDANIDIQEFPSAMIEYFIVNGLSNTTGTFNGQISASGDVTDPNIEGRIEIPKTSFTIDILGTEYFLENQIVHVNSDLIDATDVVLKDKFGNSAVVSGGLTHHNLANLGFQAELRSDEILVLDTDRHDNEVYYGTCFADIVARFNGTPRRPVITIDAENKDNSTFVINTNSETRSGGLDFIVFDFDTIDQPKVVSDVLLGVDLTIDMEVNPGVEVKIILDEATRDIMSGTGSGDLVFKYSPAGEITLFGEYVIDHGEYLFTYSVGGLVPVNKPFVIRKGSKLQWTDDPFEADVFIQAEYTVSASPYNLISDWTSTFLADAAKQKTDVELELILRGSMLQPEITFDIELPELTGQLKSAVDIELARIRTDQTEMQGQAASLIVFREFMRSEYNEGASVQAVANTISEWLSNQVSYYLTGLVSTLINDLDFIDDIQFDVGYQLPSSEFSTAGTVNSELGVSTTVIMFDRRLEASVKGDYVNSQDGNTGSSDYFNTDIEFDYILTADRRWRLRAYTKQDQFFNDRRSRTGLGLTWRREYDDLEAYKAAIRDLHQSSGKRKSNDSK